MLNNIVYDSIIYSLQKSGGISVYWKMLEKFIPITKRLVYKKREDNIFYEKIANNYTQECSIPNLLLLERYRNVNITSKDKFVFHSSYYRFCKNKNAVNITTVHDFTYELFRSDWKSLIHKFQKKNAVMHSSGVICISENTKNDLYKFYPNYKGKVKIIYHGYDDLVFYNKQKNKRTNKVIFVGSRVGYKQFDLAVKLLSKIPELSLLIIGGGELTKEEINMLDLLIPKRYEKTGFVSNEELANLYNESFALMYPSEYEGFGFPVIESQACGCPVICQPKSSIQEVSGNKCIYVNSSDFERSIINIRKLLDQDYYNEIQEAGIENVKRFSWKKCIQETMDFYEECFISKNEK